GQGQETPRQARRDPRPGLEARGRPRDEGEIGVGAELPGKTQAPGVRCPVSGGAVTRESGVPRDPDLTPGTRHRTPPSSDASSRTPRLRTILPGDFESLYQLDQVCFEPGVAYSRDELRRFLSMASVEGVAAESDGRVVGFAIGYLARAKIAHVVTLDVDPSPRREGHGRALPEALRAAFAKTCARRLRPG